MSADYRGLPLLPPTGNYKHVNGVIQVAFTALEMQAYGAVVASHAREQERANILAELEGMTCNNATARSVIKFCIEAIKELK